MVSSICSANGYARPLDLGGVNWCLTVIDDSGEWRPTCGLGKSKSKQVRWFNHEENEFVGIARGFDVFRYNFGYIISDHGGVG